MCIHLIFLMLKYALLAPIIIPMFPRLLISQICRRDQLSFAKVDKENLNLYLTELKKQPNVDAVFLQTYNGNNQGWVLTQDGAIIPYIDYPHPIRYIFCSKCQETAHTGPMSTFETATKFESHATQ